MSERALGDFFRAAVDIPEIPFGEMLWESAQRFPEKIAVVFQGRKISYRELDGLASSFANALANLGVKKGDASRRRSSGFGASRAHRRPTGAGPLLAARAHAAHPPVIPAKAGIQSVQSLKAAAVPWVPAFRGDDNSAKTSSAVGRCAWAARNVRWLVSSGAC